jgi:hypothetical protein
VTRRARGPRTAGALLALAATVLAGCTGVPSSSRPQTVESIGLGEGQSALPIRPQRNADAREIVNQFIESQGVGADQGFSVEKQFLSKQAQAWSPSTATVISDDYSVGTYDPATSEVVVTARQIGTVSAAGVYTPTLDGTGDGGAEIEFRYKVQQVAGQYRITSAHQGLLLTLGQFDQTFQQRVLYFFDINNQYLVPVLRYSALSQPARVAEWMLDQLVSTNTPPDAANVVDTDTFPPQARRVQVTTGASDTVQVRIAGSAELSGAARNLLAAQVSQTLAGVLGSDSVDIYDGQRPVSIPQVRGVRFTASDFAAARGPQAVAPDVYYLSTSPLGHIRTGSGAPIAGPIGRNAFQSVALARPAGIGQLTVAGVQQVTPSTQELVIGTQFGGVRATTVRGALLSRPAWAPGRAEVWVASGSTVYRVTTDGRTSTVSRVTFSLPVQGGRVVSLRLSPDGSRVAIVVSGARDSGQLYVGLVVRSARSVQIPQLNQVSPNAVVIKDAAWIDALRLIAVGTTQGAHVVDTSLDGSGWSAGNTSGLPDAPDSVTIASNAHAWVSADHNVWEQRTTGWASPGTGGQTPGTLPVYLG